MTKQKDAHKTQAQLVLERLRAGNTLTSLEALRRYGIIQPPRRIFDLRHAGHKVVADMVERTNRRGETVRIAVYRLAS